MDCKKNDFTLYLKVLYTMNKNEKIDPLESILLIKNMMMKSSKINSLSGRSSILAGCIAAVGASVAAYYLHLHGFQYKDIQSIPNDETGTRIINFLIVDALLIMILAVSGGLYFTYKKSQEIGEDFGSTAMTNFAKSLIIPLLAGGVFCLAFLWHGHFYYVAPMTLLVYGFTMFHASHYTYKEVSSMGILFMALAVLNAFQLQWGLWIWILGFGFLHILFGFIIYKKYNT